MSEFIDDRFSDEDEHRPQSGLCHSCGCEFADGEGWLIDGHTLCDSCADSYYDDDEEDGHDPDAT